MKQYFAAIVLTGALIQPAAAITFPSLTTIYVGSGVTDTTGVGDYATAFACANVSGKTASVRVAVLGPTAFVEGSTTQQIIHGGNVIFATQGIFGFTVTLVQTGSVTHGTVNIEATESAVFCTAMILDPDTPGPNGIQLHLVRVNPHPGTVE
jgi:hypothetical protein